MNPESKSFQTRLQRPFSCTVCGSSYSTQPKMNFHMRHECGKIQKCGMCGDTFLHYSSLYKHQIRRCSSLNNKH